MGKKILLILLVLGTNGFAQGIKFNIGSSWSSIKSNNQNFVSGNGQLSYSIGGFYDIKIKGKVHFSPELLFTNNTVAYMHEFNLTDANGDSYKYIYQYNPISIKGIETPIQLKVKGKVAYVSAGISPFINNYKFDSFVNVSGGLIIKDKISMDLRYSKGLSELDYGYKTERLTVGLSWFIRN